MQGISPILIVALVAAVAFSFYRRGRSLATRQRLRRNALLVRLAIFAVLVVVGLAVALTHPITLLGSAIGLLVGGAVAWYSLRLTRFERTPQGEFYTPNPYIGLAVLAVFLIRYVVHIAQVFSFESAAIQQAQQHNGQVATTSALPSDPLSSAAYYLFVGYYLFYFVGLLLRARQEERLGLASHDEASVGQPQQPPYPPSPNERP